MTRRWGLVASLIVAQGLMGTPVSLPAIEFELALGSQPYAPLDIHEPRGPWVIMSEEKRDELTGEFVNLLALARSKRAFDHWAGREVATCESPVDREGWHSRSAWDMRCEILMGQAGARYYFFRDPSAGTSVLETVEIEVPSQDAVLTAQLQTAVQDILGSACANTFTAQPRENDTLWTGHLTCQGV